MFDIAVATAVYCLAQNIYFEARGEKDVTAQLAVATVVMNRVRDDRFPDDPCAVVRQGPVSRTGLPLLNQCQFSWWCDGKLETIDDPVAWRQAEIFARLVLTSGLQISGIEEATHYHASYVSPDWLPKMKFCRRIGAHKFYRLIN